MRTILILLFLLVILILLIPVMLVELLRRKKDPEASVIRCQRIARWVMQVISFLSGMELTVKGAENIPEGEAVLYVPNHRGAFDYIALVTTLEIPLLFVGKQEFLKIPVLGTWIYLVGTLLINRQNRREGLKTILEAIRLVEAGNSIVIFPEGTRNKGELLEPLRFKEGSLKISSKSGCKVIPVALTGTREIFEAQAPWVKKGKVSLIFGKPIDPKDLSEEELKNYGSYVRETIVQMLKEETGR